MKPEFVETAISKFITKVKADEAVDKWTLQIVAGFLAGEYGKTRGRPNSEHQEFKLWSAWFAVNCDPQFNQLPLSNGGRHMEVATFLSVSENTIKRRARQYKKEMRGTDSLLPVLLSQRYLELKGMEVNESNLRTLSEWFRIWADSGDKNSG